METTLQPIINKIDKLANTIIKRNGTNIFLLNKPLTQHTFHIIKEKLPPIFLYKKSET